MAGCRQRLMFGRLVFPPPRQHQIKVTVEFPYLQTLSNRAAREGCASVDSVIRCSVIADPEGLLEISGSTDRRGHFG